MNNEATKSIASVPSALSSNLVPESDYRSALAGIENRMASLKAQLSINDQKTRELLQRAEESLMSSFDKAAENVDDEIYQERMRNERLLEEDDRDDSQDDRDQEDTAEDEFVEDILADVDAKERARLLREQVMATSTDLINFSEKITQKAIHLAEQEIMVLTGCDSKDATIDMIEVKQNFAQDNILDKYKHNIDKSQKVMQMVANLRKITEQLKKIDLVVPDAEEDLEETIATVEKGIPIMDRKGGKLSQTEEAIRRRVNQAPRPEAVSVEGSKDAQGKPASFFAESSE